METKNFLIYQVKWHPCNLQLQGEGFDSFSMMSNGKFTLGDHFCLFASCIGAAALSAFLITGPSGVCGGFHRSEWVTPVECWTDSTTSRESGGVCVCEEGDEGGEVLGGCVCQVSVGLGGS